MESKYFKATNDKELGICLRLLYAENAQSFVEVIMNDKNKIEFHIIPIISEDKFDRLLEKYEILIS